MGIQSLNPATGEVEKTFEEWTPQTTQQVVEDVAAAYDGWKKTDFATRAACLRSLANVLRENAEEYGRLMALEMGKPLAAGTAEANKCAMVCEFYAEHGQAMLASEAVDGCGREAYVDYSPMGTVLAVMPWNFPFWQVIRIAAPTLMAGNTMVLKHASNVPRCALAIEDAFKKSEFPDNVFRTLLIGARQVEAVIAHDSVIGVSLTGSEGAGRKVAGAAGAHLKPCVMELGGSDPFIVLPDADMAEAARIGAMSRFGNAGQTCIAAKRFIVHQSVCDSFIEALRGEMEGMTVGDPLAEGTSVGPMASTGLRDELQAQVDRCVAAGGKVLCGGEIPDGPGAFYPLTIIRDMPTDADVVQEELFGPVALVFCVQDEDEAIELANSTPFGLGGSVWTADEKRGLALARRVESGAVFVNGLVRSDPNLPFGGIKCSGFGRELAASGIRAFVNVKSVCVG